MILNIYRFYIKSLKPNRLNLKMSSMLLLCIFSTLSVLKGQNVVSESFNYPSGALLTSNNWTAIAGTGTNNMTVSTGNLVYSGSISNGIGNKILLNNNGQDVSRTYANTTAPIYSSLIVNVSAANTVGDFFYSIGTSALPATTVGAKLFIKSNGSGFSFGVLRGTGGTPVYETTVRPFNTNIMVVLKYEVVAGATNDAVKLYVNPSLSAEPGTTDAIYTASVGADAGAFSAIALLQGTAANAPTLEVDGINVGTTWATVTSPIYDYGDVPASFENDKDGNPSPALHASLLGFSIGSFLDVENSPASVVSPSQNNTVGDNAIGTADEDGIIAITGIDTGSYYSVSIPVSIPSTLTGTKYLYGWLDLNNDGVFQVGEVATATTTSTSNTTMTLTWTATQIGTIDNGTLAIYLRLRFSNVNMLDWAGSTIVDERSIGNGAVSTSSGTNAPTAAFGEVEDYQVPVISAVRYNNVIQGGVSMTGNSWLYSVPANPKDAIRPDIDGDASTTLSNSGDLILPAGSTIVKAYLAIEKDGGSNFISTKLKVPGASSYITLTAATSIANRTAGYAQMIWDITSMIPTNGYVSTAGGGVGGRYFLADPTPSAGQMGGWSIIVVYKNPNSKFRQIVVTDGWQYFTSTVAETKIKGLKIPASGVVKAVVGITGTFGDRVFSSPIFDFRDYLRFGKVGTTLTNLADPKTGATNDALNSSIAWAANNNVSSDGGPAISGNYTARNPISAGFIYDVAESYDYDADIFNATGILSPSATPVDVVLQQQSAGGDALVSGSYFISVDLATPPVLKKSLSSNSITDGGITKYTWTVTNTAADAVLQTISFTDNLPTSIKVATSPNASITGGTGGTISAVAGSGAVVISGLQLNPGQSATMSVDITNVPGQLNASCTANPSAFTNSSSNITVPDGGILDTSTIIPQCLIVKAPELDSDNDGIPDNIDLDDDNDGILDTVECNLPTSNGLFMAYYNSGNYNLSGTAYIPTGSPSTAGSGLSRTLVAINNYMKLTGIDAANEVDAIINNEYIEYKFITIAKTLNVQQLHYFANTDADSNKNYKYSVRISKDNFTTNSLISTEAYHPLAGGYDTFLTNEYMLIPNTAYTVRVYFYAVEGGSSSSIAHDDFGFKGYEECDIDLDGIPNRLDLDSDNDGCLDALEGDENVTASMLVNAGGTITVGIGSTALNKNLCADNACVDTQGVPKVVNSGGAADIGGDQGQGIGSSQNAAVNDCYCYKPAATTGTVFEAKQGITALSRAGTDNGNWPMVRKGAWTVLESKEKGFVINRVPTTVALSSITNPVEGMLVYDEQADCLKVYTTKQGDATPAWHCMITPACPD